MERFEVLSQCDQVFIIGDRLFEESLPLIKTLDLFLSPCEGFAELEDFRRVLLDILVVVEFLDD